MYVIERTLKSGVVMTAAEATPWDDLRFATRFGMLMLRKGQWTRMRILDQNGSVVYSARRREK